MQYGLEVLPYKRLKKEDSEEKCSKKYILKNIKSYIYLAFICLLISRVKLINGMAPFGIALLIAFSLHLDKEKFLICGIGSMIGYITLINKVENIAIYFISVSTIIGSNYIFSREEKKKKIISIASLLIVEYIISRLVINKMNFSISVFYSFMEVICLIPLYYIINQGIICFKTLDYKKVFSNEEMISMGIFISLILSGTWGVNIRYISLTNVVGIFFVAMVGFICGPSTGGTTGVALGAIIGMTSADMPIFISVFGICGLISGLFRDTGKYFTSLACGVTFFIVQIYLGTNTSFIGIEAIIALTAIIFIPEKIYKKLILDFNVEEKKENLSENYLSKIRNIYSEKVNGFSDLLFNISSTLDKLVDNDKLALKSKSSALIENLADRACAQCDMNSICWKREIHYTYSAFSELIQNYQENKKTMPYELERKCINRTVLSKNTEEIVNRYIINEMRKNSLCEGRELLSSQIKSMASTVKSIGEDIQANISINICLENKIKRILDKNRISYSNILCIKDERCKNVIKLWLEACGGKKSCSKKILSYMNEAVGEPMCVTSENCCIDKKKNTCSVTFEQIPKFHVNSYSAVKCKDGEKCNGDSNSFSKLKDGTYISIISDGMGSGPQAGKESEASVNLINEFCRAGFNKITAINTINSIMSMKFNEDEKFSTLDLCNIDLYSGNVEFMKVGAVASFLKSDSKIDIIKSKSLPIGVLDTVDVEIENKKVKNGDLIVMVSDGVLDYNDSNLLNSNWIVEYLKNSNSNDPKEIACEILNEAIKLNDYKIKDDMTVLVSKIYTVY
ncbi:stage II sporulation protein E [Hathewaya histolytica]|uniref:stage II sporulation protein E n=1 Tax=Hathewaya histolytica TaxID=1498 RepID=UPI003B6705E7